MKDKLEKIFRLIDNRYGKDISFYDSSFLVKTIQSRIDFTGSGSFEKYCDYIMQNSSEHQNLQDSLSSYHSEFFRNPKEFQNYFERGAVGLAVTSPDRGFIEVNHKLCQMMGYSKKELTGMSWVDISLPEDLGKNLALIQDAIDGKIESYELEKRFIRKNGRILYVKLSVVCQRNEDKTIHHFLSSFEDITERKIAEDALKESEERFRTLYENAPIGIYRTTPDGKVILANQSLLKLLGLKSIKELRNQNLNDRSIFAPVYSRERFKELIEQKGRIKGIETRLVRSDGTIVQVRESAVLIKDNEGKPLYYDGTLEDITKRKQIESELKESEGRFRSLFENMVEGFAYCKMIYEDDKPIDFIYLQVNNSFEVLTGLKNVSGKKVSEVIPGILESDRGLFETYNRVALGGSPERFEIFVSALQMWFHVTVYSPEMEYFVAVFDVINERKRVEQELKESEDKYRRMVDFSPDAVIIHSEGKIVFANPAGLRMMKANSYDQLIGTPAINFVHPDYRAFALERIKKIYDSGEAADFSEEKFITLENEIIDVEVIGVPINYLGKPAIQTIARDISARKAAKKALSEIHEFNSSILKTLPFGMQIVDETGTILFIDEKLSRLFGAQITGKKCWELYRDDKKQCACCPLFKGIQVGNTDAYEANGVLGGKIFEISHTGMLYKGKLAMLEIFQDITERKIKEAELIVAKEKAEESNKLKSVFLATMNHELRTPLNHILGFSSLIQSGAKPEEINEYASIIEYSGNNLLTIIEDMFELSLIEQSKIQIRKQAVNLLHLYMENKASLEGMLISAGKSDLIKLTFNPDIDLLSRTISSDHSKINQVLANLFKNAVKFTNSGNIEFGIKIIGNNKLMFFVKDTGIGIPKEKQSVIFEFFRQGDDSHTRVYGGIGIGLAISLKIATVMKGELNVESEPGKGSIFQFTIPIETDEYQNFYSTADNHKAAIDLSGKTLLLVEDELYSKTLIRNIIKSTGAFVIDAGEGNEALRNWQLHPEIDLVIMDLKMPGMDGFEASEILKSLKPDLPVIALTAYSMEEEILKAKKAGCNAVITKPVDKTLLFAEIRKLIN